MDFSLPKVPGAGADFDALKKKYGGFAYPKASVELGGSPLKDKGGGSIVDDIRVELTSGYEAAIARFGIFGVFDQATGRFRFDDLKKQVLLGNALTIKIGYSEKLETVFTGFVAGVNFVWRASDMPCIEVTGMDIKGIMMAGSYAERLTAVSYGEAVREILDKTVYQNLKNGGAVARIAVSDTPDKSPGGDQGESAYTVEMASESDYEFVVKAAKRFNFEFFTDRDTVYFRKAKNTSDELPELGITKGILDFDLGYSITGIAETVEALSADAGSGKVITAKLKFTNDLSVGSHAKKLIAKSRHVYIDPTIVSQEHADARAASLLETMSYRLGSLDCTCVGIPELQPGRFLPVSGPGAPADNRFYLTNVTHTLSSDDGYRTKLVGCANAVKK